MSTLQAMTNGARALIVVFVLMPASALAQPPQVSGSEYVNCPGHLYAIGSRLGWAEALARNAGPAQDAALFEHLTAVGTHAQAANAACAQTPPPWPVFQNWRQLQGTLAQMISQYQRGLMNRNQLAASIADWQQGMARDLAYRVLGTDVRADRTCGELYVRIGAALAYAQTTTQVFGRLISDAASRLQEARAAVELSTTLRPPCRDMSRLLADIDEAMRHPDEMSTVTRVNDLWSMGSLINRLGPEPVIPSPAHPALNVQDCGFHFWATGSRLGWAEAIARYGSADGDATMFGHLAATGQHIRAANLACAQEPPPWPAWQNWQQTQAQLDQIVDMYRRGLMSRAQLATALRGLKDALAGEQAWRSYDGQVYQARTCGELYVRIGAALGFAQTTTQIHGRLIQEAADQLRAARQLIELSLQLMPPCTSLAELMPLIDQVLNQPGGGSVQGVDAIWGRGSIIMAPDTASWPPPPPPTLTPTPRPAAGGVVASGGLDRADVDRRNNRLINEFGYRASSYEANEVTLEVIAPATPGQPFTARITGQVNFVRHLLHPPRPGPQFEEWWQVTVTLGPGEGNADRLVGSASATVEYRSLAPDRVNRQVFANEHWYALRQADGTYRLGLPNISDGVVFILKVR